MHIHFHLLILAIFLSLATPSAAQPAPPENPDQFFTPEAIRRQEKRFELSNFIQLMNILEIKEGMVILDIGTGSGQYAYAFAQKLKGTGKVFATDIGPEMIRHVEQQAKKRGLKNLHPILVTAEGVDEFYPKQKYDLIFLARVLHHIPDAESYLKTMKGFLTPGGRLVVITKKIKNHFIEEDIKDGPELLAKIASLPPDSPFAPYFSTFRPEAGEIKIAPGLKNKLANAFNEIYANNDFYKNFLSDNGMVIKESLPLTSEERYCVNLCLGPMKGRGSSTTTNWAHQILIYKEFGKYFLNTHPPCMPGGKQLSVDKPPLQTFEKTGYTLKKEYDFIPFHMVRIYTATH